MSKTFVQQAIAPRYVSGTEYPAIQNMLVRQYRFPHEYRFGVDDMATAWSDRIFFTPEWEHACRILGTERQYGLNTHIAELSDLTFLNYCRAWFPKQWVAERKTIGARMMRHTNVSNGFTLYTVELFAQGEGFKLRLYTGADAPNVLHPPKQTQCYDDEIMGY